VRWLRTLWARVRPASKRPARSAKPFQPTFVPIEQYVGDGDPPPLQWKACHPSTVRRFKAEVTCGQGHGLVLKGHSVSADGRVWPSVVCLSAGCAFHEFVRLKDWKFGDVR
jgi:hypothetical protein